MRIRPYLVGVIAGLASIIHAEGYEIGITLPSFSGDTVVLGNRFNASFIPKDTLILDSWGKGVFRGSQKLPQGMYLVYLPEGGEVTVDLSATPGKIRFQWFNPTDGLAKIAGVVEGGKRGQFSAPFPGDAVLWLKSV